MKFLDKIKNALFEEEYVEVEEKPKKKVSKENKKVRKDTRVETKEEKPIAKKIVLPERKEVKVTNHEDMDEKDNEDLEEEVTKEKEHKFPMISDSEFESEVKDEKFGRPHFDYIEGPEKRHDYSSHYQEKHHPKLYGINDDIPIKEPEYGTYEKKEDRTYFRPSPIISPIYGILDRNYKKEEIIPKKEVRLTSSYSRENLDLDAIRNKAYGNSKRNVENLVNNNIDTEDIEEEQGNLMDHDLLDLTNENDTVEIKKVTVGDAEEYFSELGLEYNVDYQDSSKEKATGRRSEKNQTEIEMDSKVMETENEPIVEETQYDEKMNNKEDIDDDNLFDLIDSMYDKE